MNNSLNNNKKLLRKKRLFKKERSFLHLKHENLKTTYGSLHTKQVSQEELAEIRKKTLIQRKKENIIFISIVIVVVCIFGLISYPHAVNIFTTDSTIKNPNQIYGKEATEKYIFYLTDGDKYLKQKNWHNAIFQYKKALELYPTEYAVHYRLAVAYSYQCQQKFTGCEEGMKVIKNLEKQFPDKKELINVKQVFEHWGV